MNNDIMSVEQAAATRNVTAATIKNWKRTRRLSDAEGGVFSREIEALCEAGVLTSRRNKSSLRCSRTDTGYIVGHDKLKKLLDGPMCRDEIRAILAEAALRLFLKGENLLDGFLKGTVTVSDSDRLIADLASGAVIDRNNAHILSAPWEADKGQDVLGFVYSSLLPLDQRRAAGAYYTPLSVAAAAVSKPELKGSILDPCCGSGSFLIAAAQAGADMEELFGIDMDPTAVCLARINLRCRFPELSLDYLYKHIQCLDFFDISTKYSCVIGNPPWGGKPEMSERFILHAMELLNSNGSFSLLIPQALLSVRLHSHLREKMLETLSFLSVDYMGNCFKGVYCPSVILAAKKSENPGLKGCRVNSSFVINSDREIDPRCLNLLVTDEEYRRLQKMKSIKHAAFLKGSAIFGLGIVTGSNSRCL